MGSIKKLHNVRACREPRGGPRGDEEFLFCDLAKIELMNRNPRDCFTPTALAMTLLPVIARRPEADEAIPAPLNTKGSQGTISLSVIINQTILMANAIIRMLPITHAHRLNSLTFAFDKSTSLATCSVAAPCAFRFALHASGTLSPIGPTCGVSFNSSIVFS